jgi:alpha-beta hydrolase superfamily lysophospholipase
VKVLIIHGAGGHVGALWPFTAIVGADDVEILALDLPLYGRTESPHPAQVRYRDWVDLLSDFVTDEQRTDSRPLILFGASMGGMLAYETASRTDVVAAVLATCLLDPGDRAAREAASRWALLGRTAPRTLPLLSTVASHVRLPIRWLARMSAMSNNAELTRLCAADRRGGGARVPLGFLSDWFTFEHTDPASYGGPPVTLVHPGADRWTPSVLSERFMERIGNSNHVVWLDDCGHYPVEEPGLTQLEATVRRVVASVAG